MEPIAVVALTPVIAFVREVVNVPGVTVAVALVSASVRVTPILPTEVVAEAPERACVGWVTPPDTVAATPLIARVLADASVPVFPVALAPVTCCVGTMMPTDAGAATPLSAVDSAG